MSPPTRQETLPLGHVPSLSETDFLVTAGNEIAWRTVLAPERWGSVALRLCGPTGSGKSHLAAIFMRIFPTAACLDDAQKMAETALFHRLNALAEENRWILFTAPGEWAPSLPDAASRWNALPRVDLSSPDDALLYAVLEKSFSDRQLRVSGEILSFLHRRIERSFAEVRTVVALLDQEALRRSSPITMRLVREMLERRKINSL